jgi:hypothetical protein
MERYLRTFVSYYQDDWDTLIPSAEFAINSAMSETTKISPFMATRGYEPRMSFDAEVSRVEPKTARERIAFGKAKSIVEPMQAIWDWTKAWMKVSQEKQRHYADQKRRNVENTIVIGQKVWLDMRNIKTARPCKKLDSKWEGPFKVLRQFGKVAYELELPHSMHIHPVFHASLLSADANDPLPGQEYPLPGPVEVDQEGEASWEVEDILDVKKTRGRGKNVLIRASWVGHPPDLTYYPSEDFKGSEELLQDFYERHPGKPRPDWLERVGES